MGCLKLSHTEENTLLKVSHRSDVVGLKGSAGPNRYGYQGQYAEEDTVTGFSSFELRMYDPIIGRWLQVDPYRVGYSPYIGMANSPIKAVDPDGGAPEDIIFMQNGEEVGRIATDDNFDIVINNWDLGGELFDFTSVAVFDKIFYSPDQLSPEEYLTQYELYVRPKYTGEVKHDYTIESLVMPGPKGAGVASKSIAAAEGFNKTFKTIKGAFRFAKSINRIPSNNSGQRGTTFDKNTGELLPTWTYKVGGDKFVIRMDKKTVYWGQNAQTQLPHFNVSRNGKDLGQHFTFLK